MWTSYTRWRLLKTIWIALGKARLGYFALAVGYLFSIFWIYLPFFYLAGLIAVFRGRGELKVKHANWVCVGFFLGFLAMLFEFIAYSMIPDSYQHAQVQKAMYVYAGSIVLSQLAIFTFVYNVFPRKGKMIVISVFGVVIIGTIINYLFVPWDIYLILRLVFGFPIPVLLFVTSAIYNKARRGWIDKKESYRYQGEDDDEEEEEDDEDEDLNVLERLRRKQRRELEKSTTRDEKKFEGEKHSPEMARKESQSGQKKCINCGHFPIPADGQFCAVCGADQTSISVHKPETPPKRCINCGVGLASLEVTFCHVCGARQIASGPVETTEPKSKCIDCGAAVKPPLVFCNECMAKQLYSAPAQQPLPSSNVPIPTEPSGGRYVHQQQMQDIPITPQRYGHQPLPQQDSYLPPPPQ